MSKNTTSVPEGTTTLSSVSDKEMLTRYEQAKTFYQEDQRLVTNTWAEVKEPLVMARNTTPLPVWIGESECFWYERERKNGREYRLVDASEGSNKLAFDHSLLANKL